MCVLKNPVAPVYNKNLRGQPLISARKFINRLPNINFNPKFR